MRGVSESSLAKATTAVVGKQVWAESLPIILLGKAQRILYKGVPSQCTYVPRTKGRKDIDVNTDHCSSHVYVAVLSPSYQHMHSICIAALACSEC